MNPIPPLRVVAISHQLAPNGSEQVRMIRAELGIWQVLADMDVRVLRLCPAADGPTAAALGRLSRGNLRVQGHSIVPSRPLTFSRYLICVGSSRLPNPMWFTSPENRGISGDELPSESRAN